MIPLIFLEKLIKRRSELEPEIAILKWQLLVAIISRHTTQAYDQTQQDR